MGGTSAVDSLFIRACRGERCERAPIWLMRQAGRYLPEYRAVRSKHSMLDVIRTAELAAQVTLQPIQRFGFDAAIIFADILNPLIGMGIQLDFVESKGPVIGNPVKSPAAVAALRVPTPDENVPYTLSAIRQVKAALGSTPLIGFAGAPFTLSAYLIDGSSRENLAATKAFMWREEKAWHELQTKLETLISDYLIAQAVAGADALQIFDSWLGLLGPSDYQRYVAPYLKSVVAKVKQKTDVPVIFFSTSTQGLYPYFADLGCDLFGVDWRINLREASALLGERFPLQGNLDPHLLIHGGEPLERAARGILAQRSELRSHIFNLGHGILPETPIENVERLLAIVRGQE